MKSLFLIFVVIYFSGCSYGSPYRQVKPNEIIQNRYVSIMAPSTEWEIRKTYKGFLMLRLVHQISIKIFKDPDTQ